ncbi:VPLPA-CTERM sorting domain-containing protein [Jannaschia formosa]|uniref:VPLPA-CTERM sorting domain-containing protein n=1 Tax=Jannaschia formosa TaxID=2259592 RepID=UPI00143050C2|nr:VPLPA-CTERM sorting domain-containing protein [Jannaschia formosa]
MKRGGEWQIAGVLTGGTTPYGEYGDISQWTSVFAPTARSFIESESAAAFAPIPLPATLILMLAALAGLGATRRRAG